MTTGEDASPASALLHEDGGDELPEITLELPKLGPPFFRVPVWYHNLTGRVSVMTPYSTSIVTNKQAGSIRPFVADYSMVARHYAWPEEMTYDEVRHEDLHPDKIRFKPWGEDERIYRVVIDDQREVSPDV